MTFDPITNGWTVHHSPGVVGNGYHLVFTKGHWKLSAFVPREDLIQRDADPGRALPQALELHRARRHADALDQRDPLFAAHTATTGYVP